MTTAIDLISGALEHLGINPSDSPITGGQLNRGIRRLNGLLSTWESSGILLGFSRIKNGADVVRVPFEAEQAIESSLAALLAPSYSKGITPTLSAIITDMMNKMLRSITEPINVEYPDTLPVGSGNDCQSETVFRENFFNENSKENF